MKIIGQKRYPVSACLASVCVITIEIYVRQFSPHLGGFTGIGR